MPNSASRNATSAPVVEQLPVTTATRRALGGGMSEPGGCTRHHVSLMAVRQRHRKVAPTCVSHASEGLSSGTSLALVVVLGVAYGTRATQMVRLRRPLIGRTYGK